MRRVRLGLHRRHDPSLHGAAAPSRPSWRNGRLCPAFACRLCSSADPDQVLPWHLPHLAVKTDGNRPIGKQPRKTAAVGQLDVQGPPACGSPLRWAVWMPPGAHPARRRVWRGLPRGDSIVPARTFSPTRRQCGAASPSGCSWPDSLTAGVFSDQSCRTPTAESLTGPNRSDFSGGTSPCKGRTERLLPSLKRQAIERLRFAADAEAVDLVQSYVQSAPGRGRVELPFAAGEQQALAVVGFDDGMGLGRRLAVAAGGVQEEQVDLLRRQFGSTPPGPSSPGPWLRSGRRGFRRCEGRGASGDRCHCLR